MIYYVIEREREREEIIEKCLLVLFLYKEKILLLVASSSHEAQKKTKEKEEIYPKTRNMEEKTYSRPSSIEDPKIINESRTFDSIVIILSRIILSLNTPFFLLRSALVEERNRFID